MASFATICRAHIVLPSYPRMTRLTVANEDNESSKTKTSSY